MVAPGSNVQRQPRPLVWVVGAGGLGGPIALGLAHAGAQVLIWDADVIDSSNLARQLQFTCADVGQNKALAVAAWANAAVATSPQCDAPVVACPTMWSPTVANAELAATRPSVVVEGSDHPETKFAVNDWAVAKGIPAVIAGAVGTEATVCHWAPGSACLRCWFEGPPTEAASCAAQGVLGPMLAGVAAIAVAGAIEHLRCANNNSDLAQATAVPRPSGWLWRWADATRAVAPRRVQAAPVPSCACATHAAPPRPRPT